MGKVLHWRKRIETSSSKKYSGSNVAYAQHEGSTLMARAAPLLKKGYRITKISLPPK
jgi:hypothetical protein